MAQSLNSKEVTNNHLDKVKWCAIFALLIGGVVANYYFSDQLLVVRLIGWLLLLCVVGVFAAKTQKGQQIWKFLQDARIEMRKVVWPTRQETVKTTLSLLGVIVLMSLILWAVDTFLMWIVGFFTG